MKNIHETIKKVQDHFIEKLLAGEFELTSADEHTAKITIDSYPFVLWIANKPENRRFWDGSGGHYLRIEITKDQSLKAFEVTEPIIQEWRKTKGKEATEKKIAELTKQLEELEGLKNV